MSAAALIAVDWGTTAFRAYRLDEAGRIQDRTESRDGILTVAPGGFPATFERLLAPWLAQTPHLPILLSGMIGSRQGWVECPYVACPAGAEDLARALVPLVLPSGVSVAFVPGVQTAGSDGFPDVMRGEETQIIGETAGAAGTEGILLLPGTHSKWAMVESGRIRRFATFMTGELFAVLSQHSILGRLMDGQAHDPPSYRAGLDQGRRGTLLNDLFSARTLGLFGRVPPAGLSAYLSGLLIGHEIAEAQAGRLRVPADAPVQVIGSSALTPLYLDALSMFGFDPRPAEPDSAARGLFAIGRLAGLVRP